MYVSDTNVVLYVLNISLLLRIFMRVERINVYCMYLRYRMYLTQMYFYTFRTYLQHKCISFHIECMRIQTLYTYVYAYIIHHTCMRTECMRIQTLYMFVYALYIYIYIYIYTLYMYAY